MARFVQNRPNLRAQRHIQAKCRRSPSSGPSIREWHTKFPATESVLRQTGCARSSTYAKDLERIRAQLVCSPLQFTPWRNRPLDIPRARKREVPHVSWRLNVYKVQTVKALSPKPVHYVLYSPQTLWKDWTKTVA